MAALKPNDSKSFPTDVNWPKDGVEYDYEVQHYVIPKKMEYWLQKAFGSKKAKCKVGPYED
jgi:hypothetical protein